jgi:hypothetical protein
MQVVDNGRESERVRWEASGGLGAVLLDMDRQGAEPVNWQRAETGMIRFDALLSTASSAMRTAF